MEIVKGSGVKQGELLEKVNSPADLKKLNPNQLEQFCKELRQYIVDIVSTKGGLIIYTSLFNFIKFSKKSPLEP